MRGFNAASKSHAATWLLGVLGVQVDCGTVCCESAGARLTVGSELRNGVAMKVPPAFFYQPRFGVDWMSTRLFLCIALQCVDRLASNETHVLRSKDQLLFRHCCRQPIVAIDPRHTRYVRQEAADIPERLRLRQLVSPGQTQDEPPQFVLESLPPPEEFPLFEDVREERTRVRLAQKALRDFAVAGRVDQGGNGGDAPPPYRVTDLMSVLESTFTTFAQLRDALVSSYVEQGPSGDYRQQFWVGACRPYLHCDQDELHVSDTTRLLAAQRGARGQSLGKDAVYCTRCVPRVIHDLDGPGYLPLDESDWDSSGLSSTDLGRRTWLNEMRNVKYILRTGAATQVNVWRHTLPWTATCIPKTGALPLSPEGNETILQTIATAIADKRLINLGVMLQYYRLSRKMVKTIRLQIEKLLKLVATQQWEVRKGYSRGVRKAASKGWFIDSYDQVYIMISPPTDILDRKTKTAAFQVVLTRDCLKSHSQEDANKRNEEFFTKLSVDAHSESEPVCQFTHASAACFV